MKIVTACTGSKYVFFDYVGNLYRSLTRNTTIPFEFEVIRQTKYPGWWGKIELFPSKERIIFLDLDIVVVGNCDFLFDYQGDFAIAWDKFLNDGGYDSSVMGIGQGFGAEIREDFEINPHKIMQTLHSDQELIENHDPGRNFDHWQDLFPGKFQSFKGAKLDSCEPDNQTALVHFHGEPKPHQVSLPWVRDAWR